MNARAQELMKQINKALGDSAVKMGSDKSLVVKYVTTGLLPFDILMPGGLPLGRMVEVFGGPSSLKSYLGLKAIAANQAAGKMCGLIDTEHTFDPEWAENCGVSLDNLLLQQPETGELALDTAEALIRNGVDLLVFDSVAAAQPQTERVKRLSDEKVQPGTHARMFSIGLRKLTAANNTTSILFINQTRTNIGVTFGNPEVTPGGKALPFYASLRMRIQHAGKINVTHKTFDGEKWVDSRHQVAQKFRATMEKSKLSAPYGEVSFIWSLNDGQIDLVTFLLAQGLETGVVTQSGQTWTYQGKKYNGRKRFVDALAADDEMLRMLECDVREHHGLPVTSTRKPKERASAAKSGAKKSSSPGKRLVVRKKAASTKARS